jgi:hypothetical protein
MPASPRILTGNLTDISAAPASGVTVTFTRVGVSAQYGDVVIPQKVRTVTTSGGALSQQLYPGDYRGQARMDNGPAVFTFTLTEDGPTDLAELLEEQTITPTAQIVLDTRAARDAAIAAVAAVPLLRDAFSTVQDLLTDTTLTYANTVENQVIPAGGFRYRRAASTATDHHVTTAGGVKMYVLPGTDGYNLQAFGAVGDGVTDDTGAWNAANDYMESIGGGRIILEANKTYILGQTTLASNTICVSNGRSALKVLAGFNFGNWITNRNVNTASAERTAENCGFINVDFVSENNPPRWLTRLDGSAVTDPEADYVMGSGALASGISGVSLTAVLTDGVVTSVTINNGGTGWNGHSTYPYVPSTVPLKFSGGAGAGARAFATIVGGALTSVTIESGGIGYTSAPAVTTMGGFADIALLTQPSVNRRNPNYTSGIIGVSLNKVINPIIRHCTFTGFKGRAIDDNGCLDGDFYDLHFKNCGKDDGPFHCIRTQSFGNPFAPSSAFADSENSTWQKLKFENCERSAMMFSPTKGGTVRDFKVRGYGESAFFMANVMHANGGQSTIEVGEISDGTLTDIAGAALEGNGLTDLTVRDVTVNGTSREVASLTGSKRVYLENMRLKNNGTSKAKGGDGFIPYGPFSERFGFNVGARPIAGSASTIQSQRLFRVGTFSGVGCDDVVIRGGFVEETRAVFPSAIINVEKTGGNNLSKDFVFENVDVIKIPGGMSLLSEGQGDVFDSNMPVFVRGNRGHASEGAVIVTDTVFSAATGVRDIACGFRPSLVTVYASNNNGTLGQMAIGEFSWNRAAVRNDFSMTANLIGEDAAISPTDVIRIKDDADVVVGLVEFTSWLLTGFRVNVITATIQMQIRYVCHP